MNWTDEQIATALTLWNERGLSASQIGQRIGKSRSAVCGFVDRERERLGFNVRGHAVEGAVLAGRVRDRREAKRRRQTKPTGRPCEARPSEPKNEQATLAPCPTEAIEAMPEPTPAAPIIAPEPPPLPAEPVTVLTLTPTTCRWPIGHPGEEGFHFCGCYAPVGQPFCAEHMKVAYQPAPPRRRVTPSRASRVA